MILAAQKSVEIIPQMQISHYPLFSTTGAQVQTVQKPAEISQLPTVDKVLTCPLLCNDRGAWS